jgi:hypothetical protein
LFNLAYTDTGTDSQYIWIKGNVEFASGHGAFTGCAGLGLLPIMDVPSATRFFGLAGDLRADGNATESDVAFKCRGYDVFEALQVRVTANARTNDSVFRNRINAGDGTGVITFGAGVTGLLTATGLADAIGDGQTVNTSLTLLTGVEDLTVAFILATLKSSSGKQDQWSCAQDGETRTASATAEYFPIGGFCNAGQGFTEAQCQIKPGFAGVASNLRVYCDTNTYTGNGTLKLYQNGSPVITTTITAAGGAAWYENTSDSVSFDADDVFSFELDEGTSGSIHFHLMGITFSPPAGGGTTVSAGVVTHSYTGQNPQVLARVQPGAVVHTYTGQVPTFRHTVRPAQVTHSYTAQAPQVRARVQPGAVVHTYTAQTPQVRARIQPAQVTHSYAGRVPGITAGAGLNAPVATHSYTGQTPQARVRVQPGAVVHTYTGQTPQVRARVQPGAVTHTYTGRVPSVSAGAGVNVPASTHSYVGRVPKLQAKVQPAPATHTYTSRVPNLATGGQVFAAVATHSYVPRSPKLQAQVRAAVVTHVYSAVVPAYVAQIAYTSEPLRARIGATPAADVHTRIGTSPVADVNERIGPEVGTVTTKRIGDPAK